MAFKKVIAVMLVVVVTCTFGMFGCEAGTTQSTGPSAEIRCATSAPGTAAYMQLTALGETVKKYTDGRINIMLIGTSGYTEVMDLFRSGDVEMISTTDSYVINTTTAGGPWKDKEKTPPGEITSLVGYTLATTIYAVKADSPLKHLKDIKGRKWAGVSPTKSIGTYLTCKALEYYDIDYEKDTDARWTSYEAAFGDLGDGAVDMATMLSGDPTPLYECARTHKLRLLDMESDKIVDYLAKEITNGYPSFAAFYVDDAAPWVLEGMGDGYVGDPHYQSWGATTQFSIRSSIPEDVVYEITKILWEHKDELDAAYAPWARVGKSLGVELLTGKDDWYPFHPGAMKYYQEQGWLDKEGKYTG